MESKIFIEQLIFPLTLALIAGLSGFFIRSLFDNRDLRRTIIDGPLNNFEKVTTLLAGFYKNELLINKKKLASLNKQATSGSSTNADNDLLLKKERDELQQEMVDHANFANRELTEAKNSIVWAARRIDDKVLESLAIKVFSNLHHTLNQYNLWFFEESPNLTLNVEAERKKYIDNLERADNYLKNDFKIEMAKLYKRYWQLSTRVILPKRTRRWDKSA